MIPGVSDNTFALVVPTLNEAGNIDKILTAITEALSDTPYEYEIEVVDDGSTDGTVENVRDWSKRDERVGLLSATGERGVAGAVLYGWSQSRANLLGVIDADLQHPPELLPELLKAAERADIAIASRHFQAQHARGSASHFQEKSWRH